MEISKSKKKYGKFEDYEIESAADAIIRAEEIKKDEEKMKYVTKVLKAKGMAAKNAIKSLKDIKEAAEEMEDLD